MKSLYRFFSSDLTGDLCNLGSDPSMACSGLPNPFLTTEEVTLCICVDLYGYAHSVTTRQHEPSHDIDCNPRHGGESEPWGNVITISYRSIDSFPIIATFTPNYVFRSNIPGVDSSDNAWTKLPFCDGAQWYGPGINWGGLSENGLIDARIAYANNLDTKFAIPLADISNPTVSDINLQLFTTQAGSRKGFYDTNPNNDLSSSWDDPTTQSRLISVPVAVDPIGDLASPAPGEFNFSIPATCLC